MGTTMLRLQCEPLQGADHQLACRPYYYRHGRRYGGHRRYKWYKCAPCPR